MFIKDYKYIVGNPTIETLNRKNYHTPQYLKMLSSFFDKIELCGDKVAFLHALGPAIHHSDGRNIKGLSPTGSIPIKSQGGYYAYQIARMLPDVEYVNINANTCASSVYSIHEAFNLMYSEGYSDVFIYSDEMKEPTQELLFNQLGIDLICSDGAAIVHLAKFATNQKFSITGSSWKWNNESSPMTVSEDGYSKVIEDLVFRKTDTMDFIKTHGTGTVGNNRSEYSAIEKYCPSSNIVEYKNKIGHSQGASGLIELCMLIDDDSVKGHGILLASGLGGFYGGIRVCKK